MTTQQHTPTPWIAQDNQIIDTQDRMICPLVQAYDVKDGAYASGSQLKAVDDGGTTNAAFIVRACNSHDALVAALEKSQAIINAIHLCPTLQAPQIICDALIDIAPVNRAALALAKGE